MKAVPSYYIQEVGEKLKLYESMSVTELSTKELAILSKTDVPMLLEVFLTKDDLLKYFKCKDFESLPPTVKVMYKESEKTAKDAGLLKELGIIIARFAVKNFEIDDTRTKKYTTSGHYGVKVKVPMMQRSCSGWYVQRNNLNNWLTPQKGVSMSKSVTSVKDSMNLQECFLMMKKLYEDEYKSLNHFHYQIHIPKGGNHTISTSGGVAKRVDIFNYDEYFEFFNCMNSINPELLTNAYYFGWNNDAWGPIFQIRFMPAQGDKARVIFYFPSTTSALIFKGNKNKPFEIINDRSMVSSIKDILIRKNNMNS